MALRGSDDAPEIHLDSGDDSAMTTSDYAQVVFQDVQESYPPGRYRYLAGEIISDELHDLNQDPD